MSKKKTPQNTEPTSDNANDESEIEEVEPTKVTDSPRTILILLIRKI